MPIKPDNRARYPADWPQIRAAILERADHRCEKCSAGNGTYITRGAGEDADTYMTGSGDVFDAETGGYLGRARASDYCHGKTICVVLTIAHLDHTPENSDPDNLRSWRQRCHLRYDAAHHARNAWQTRRARKAVGDLFDCHSAQTAGQGATDD